MMNINMKKCIITLTAIFLMMCTGCNAVTKPEMPTEHINQIRNEIDTCIQEALGGKYENLVFKCDSVEFPKDDVLRVITLRHVGFTEGMDVQTGLETTLERYNRLLGKTLNTELLYDCSSRDDIDNGITTEIFHHRNYEDACNVVDTYEVCPAFVYIDQDNYTKLEMVSDGQVFYINQGVLGNKLSAKSSFSIKDSMEFVKHYECNTDDMSDVYMLMDGEMSVAEGKRQIEEYYNSMYPLNGQDNDIYNYVYSIDVMKIPGEEIYAFAAYRTLGYKDIQIKPTLNGSMTYMPPANETGIMAEAVMAEHNKVDVTLGMVNSFEVVDVGEEITGMVSFDKVMTSVSEYLTGKTDFVVSKVGIQYRMFGNSADSMEEQRWELVPYWIFYMVNEKDRKTLYVYVDVQTGAVSSDMVYN